MIASGLMGTLGLAVAGLILIGVHDIAENYRTDQLFSTSLKVVHLVKRGTLPPVLPEGEVRYMQVLNARGEIVSRTSNMIGKPQMARFVPGLERAGSYDHRCDTPAFPGRCVIIIGFRIYEPEGDWVVYAADDEVPWYVNPQLVAVLLAGTALLVVVTALGISRTITKTLRPVEAINAELAEINATDLGRRVPVPGEQSEIRSLAETVNRTLDRLEALVEQQRRFASDASHDLRSPLTAMRAQIESAMLAPDDADWNRVSRAQLESLERLEALVSDLLMLTKLDASAPSARELLDLSQLVAGELRHRARQVQVVRHLKPGVKVRGDRLRLARLLTNLVDNAERHADARITISVGEDGRHAVLEVLDDGAGIPRDQREVVFQRFTRLDAARSKDAGGTGLGLPIAREIAQKHGGSLTVEDSETGARFVARFPLADSCARTP